MPKSMIFIQFLLVIFLTFIYGKPSILDDQLTSSNAMFLKPKASVMRRVNPLKLLFTVAYVPDGNPPYSVEWNMPLLKTMLLESSFVTDEDKASFVNDFSDQLSDYANWSDEKHYELERFTEKYFNIYKNPQTFLPFVDCTALTNALIDEMINDVNPTIDQHKRAEARARAVERLCNAA